MRAGIRLRAIERSLAEADVAEAKIIARRERLRAEDILAQIFDITLAVIDGDVARAEALAVDAISRGSSNLGSGVPLGFLGLYSMRIAQGRLAELEDDARKYAPLFGISSVDFVGPVLLARGATDALRALADEDDWIEPPRDWFWPSQHVLRAQVVIGLDDKVRARRQYELLAPFGGTAVVVPGFAVHGPADTHLGSLALTWGDTQLAMNHHETAVRLAAELRSRPWLEAATALLNDTRQRAAAGCRATRRPTSLR